jgi:hypothetical protein
MGKGGGEAPSEVSTITIPKYAQPYMEKLLGQTEALTETPIASYTGERIAGPTVAQREARLATQGMQLPGSIAEGTELTRMGGLESLLRSQYTPLNSREWMFKPSTPTLWNAGRSDWLSTRPSVLSDRRSRRAGYANDDGGTDWI